MKPAHTPGPWHWNGYSLLPCNPDPDAHAIHTILEVDTFAWGFVGKNISETTPENDANCALIAAAPELLESLIFAEALLSELKEDAGKALQPQRTTSELNIAISKARNAIINASNKEQS